VYTLVLHSSLDTLNNNNNNNSESENLEVAGTPANTISTETLVAGNFRKCKSSRNRNGLQIPMPIPECIKVFSRPLYSIDGQRRHDCFCRHCSDTIFVPQSGMITVADSNVNNTENDTKHQNVKFADQISSYEYDMPFETDMTRMATDSNDAELGNFFSRPIKIAEQEWGTGTSLGFDFNPWEEYFTNPRVINRITNYNLLRCSLKVKIVINGNGFQYGRAIAHYLPHDLIDDLTTTRFLVQEDIVQASQMPKIFLDPTTSSGGELHLPFFFYKNNMNIPSSDWLYMGRMYIRSINDLKHANGATDQVTVSVFAWAEDVTLSVLTSDESSALVAQSGMESDEVDEANSKGFISGPATAVAKAASALKSIPVMKPYATATEMGATTVAKVAKALGYCRPPETKNPTAYKPRPVSDLAVCTIPDGLAKLTVDDKQELTIDPRISGVNGADPMNIKEIAMRESYLTTFNWNIGTAPESILFNMRLDPVTWAEEGTPTAFHFPACAVAAMPFKFWTGKMRIRFQIVCSAFHKGRLKFVYDPNVLSSNEYNTNYLQIVDIADKTDFTLEIGNGQENTLLDHATPGVTSVTNMYSTTAYTANAPGNGVLGVYVVNELTTPNSTANNDIQVNVYVSMGDDFEVFVPDDHFQNFTFKPQSGFEAQSGVLVPESQNTNEPSAPYHTMTEKLGPEGDVDDSMNRVFSGEAITSFRTLLKRYNLHSIVASNDGGAQTDMLIYGSVPPYPYLRGAVAGAVNTTVLAAGYNYVNTVLLHWVTYCHSGWRGSIRWKWIPRINPNDEKFSMAVTRGVYEDPNYDGPNIVTGTSFANHSAAAHSVVPNPSGLADGTSSAFTGINGQAYTCGTVNPNLEFEAPYYNFLRYSPGKEENLTSGSNTLVPLKYKVTGTISNSTTIEAHCAAGEDFQVYFFTGMPVMYYDSSVPAPP